MAQPQASPFLAELASFISVDLETAGPDPEEHALLSIGACTLLEPRRTFYAELIPDRPANTAEAQSIHQLSLERLAETGLPPASAMRDMAAWLNQVVPGRRPVFLAFNAPFDWMFLNRYFYRYHGSNPFGHSALDIKAFDMGIERVPWSETGYDKIAARLGLDRKLTHNALQDAVDQADLFLHIMQIAHLHES